MHETHCYIHRHVAAALSCGQCGRMICNRCTQTASGRVVCPACVDDVARAAAWGKVWRTSAIFVAVALVISTAIAALWSLGDGDDADARTPYARALAEATRRADDPAAWIRVGDTAMEDGARVLAEDAFRRALKVAPNDPTTHGRLGQLFFAIAKDEVARRHLEQARLLGGGDPEVEATLAQLDARERGARHEAELVRGRMAEAREEAAEAEARAARARAEDEVVRAKASRESAAATLAEAESRRLAARADIEGREACRVPLQHLRNGGMLIDVRVDGVPARFIFDTGATRTMITSSLADRAGLDVDSGRIVRAVTANGTTEMPLADADRVDVEGAAVHGVVVAVCDNCLDGTADGLFGLDLQREFGLDIDVVGGRAWLPGCD